MNFLWIIIGILLLVLHFRAGDESPICRILVGVQQSESTNTLKSFWGFLRKGIARCPKTLEEKYLAGEELSEKADINADLRIAAARGQVTKVKELIERGANVNAGGPATNQVPKGTTALMLASAQNFKAIVEILLSAGANPNQADEGGATSLIYAVWKGNHEIIAILIEHNANPNARMKDGRTPLSVAEGSGHLAIAKLLKRAGARVKS